MSTFPLSTKYAWIGQDIPSAKEIPNHGCSISEIDRGAHDSSPNVMNGFLLSEVDWGACDSSFFLYLKCIDHNGKPKDLFTQD